MSCPCCGGPEHPPAAEPPPCPGCGGAGRWVERVTPRHTLLPPLRPAVTEARRYAFCATPGCATVYYSGDLGQRFLDEELIHPVSEKSEAPGTPLCYCFKELKGRVREEIAADGRSGVVERIEARIAERGCFCEKSNPSGVCCLEAIEAWLRRQRAVD